MRYRDYASNMTISKTNKLIRLPVRKEFAVASCRGCCDQVFLQTRKRISVCADAMLSEQKLRRSVAAAIYHVANLFVRT